MSQARALIPASEAPPRPVATVRPWSSAEECLPPARNLIGVSLVTATLVSVAALAVGQLFALAMRSEMRKKQLEPVNAILQATRAEERARLERYQWVKRSEGVMRIPISRARELVLADYARPSTSTPASSSGAPPDASARSAP